MFKPRSPAASVQKQRLLHAQELLLLPARCSELCQLTQSSDWDEGVLLIDSSEAVGREMSSFCRSRAVRSAVVFRRFSATPCET